jgi:hypothetical protein
MSLRISKLSIRYSNGPARDGSIGFTRKRTITPLQKPYTNMTLQNYPPYKAIRDALPIGLFGPVPFNPTSCACGRYIIDNFCICASSCISMPKYNWVKLYPELYQTEQLLHARLKNIWYLWYHQNQDINHIIYTNTIHIIKHFYRLRDNESSIDCYECELYNDYCSCNNCENCGDKYCYGCTSF